MTQTGVVHTKRIKLSNELYTDKHTTIAHFKQLVCLRQHILVQILHSVQDSTNEKCCLALVEQRTLLHFKRTFSISITCKRSSKHSLQPTLFLRKNKTMSDKKKAVLSGHRSAGRGQPAPTVTTTPPGPTPTIVLPPLPTTPHIPPIPTTSPPPLPTPAVAKPITTNKKAKAVAATSPKAKKDDKKASSDKEVPDELSDGVVTHVRDPLVKLLAGDSYPKFPGRDKTLATGVIPEECLEKGTAEYTEFYKHCEKYYCLGELLCVTEIDELKKYHGNYEKFMTKLHKIWTKRIQTANDEDDFNATEKPLPEDTPANLPGAHTIPLQVLIDKYWDSAKGKPKKLSKVV